MIYLIECKHTKSYKIGYSNNPHKRLTELQTGNAYFLNILATIEGSIKDEKLLHNKFNKYKLKGEWFKCNDEIKNYFKVEEVWLLDSSLIAVFTNMEQSEIRVYGYLLQYGNGLKFDVSKAMRKEIASVTSLNERTIYNTLRVLVEKKLIFKHESGLYQLNPRYAYQGSTTDRAVALKTIITLGYEC